MPVKRAFTEEKLPTSPDYSQETYWSALPSKKDSADHLPKNSVFEIVDNQNNAPADVFFIYPTHFFPAKNGTQM